MKDALATAKKTQAAVNRAIRDWNIIVNAANAHGIDPALLAAIGIRETGFQNIPQQGGGNGRGVFQIDIGKNPSVTEKEAYDVQWAASWAASRLSQNEATLAQKYPNFTPDQLEQATAASYNFGTKNIHGDPSKIDDGTTGNNYGSNVQNLKQAFKDPATGLTPKAGSNNGGRDGC